MDGQKVFFLLLCVCDCVRNRTVKNKREQLTYFPLVLLHSFDVLVSVDHTYLPLVFKAKL